MADAFHTWWDKSGYTCKDIGKYEDMMAAWNAGIDSGEKTD